MEKSYSASYAAAGVDITAGYRSVELMKTVCRPHHDRGLHRRAWAASAACLSWIAPVWKQPVLISGTDGVGTKLQIAMLLDKHDTIGIDCVAMCVNDVICCRCQAAVFPGLHRLRQERS